MTIRKNSLLALCIFALYLTGSSTQTTQAQTNTCIPYHQLLGDQPATIVVYDEQSDTMIAVNPHRAAQRFAPYSTFKIFNALVALDTGSMPNVETQIVYDPIMYPLTEVDNSPPFDQWRQDHNLRTGMQYSVVWFYTEVARLIGQETMQAYLESVPYGNSDASAWIDERQFWLGNGLEISALEQMDFLRRLINFDLPFTDQTMRSVRDIIILEETDTYRLSGKTGTQLNGMFGWFVGYVEVENNRIILVVNIDDTPEERTALKDRVVENILACNGVS